MTTNLVLREGQLPEALNGGLFISPGYGRHPRRTIDNIEIIFIRSGRLTMWEEKSFFSLKKYDTLLLFSGREHFSPSDYDKNTQFYWIHFRLDSNQYLLSEEDASKAGFINVPQHTEPGRPERLIDLYRQFLHGQQEGFCCGMEADLLVAQMLVELAFHGRTTDEDRSAHRLAEQVKKIISAEYHDPSLCPGEIACRLDVNPDYLGRVFKKVTKTSIGQFLIERRLREARQLLQESNLNVKQIALATGFHDPGYFRRLFRRHFDMCPANLRKLYFRVHINVR